MNGKILSVAKLKKRITIVMLFKILEAQGKNWTQKDNPFCLFTHMSKEMGELARHIITIEYNLSLKRPTGKPTPREKIISLIKDDLGDFL